MPDGDTERFLAMLFAPYLPDEGREMELRCFRLGQGGSTVRRWYPLTPAGWAAAAQEARAHAPNRDVYFSVLPRQHRRGDARGLRLCAWLWADIDGGDDGPASALSLLKSAVEANRVPPPPLLVVSGGGLHAYWRLSDPMPCDTPAARDSVRRLLRRLVLAIGGAAPRAHADRASAEPARILRLPGTFNHKRTPPRPVRLLRCRDDALAFPAVWWGATLPAEPQPPRPPSRFQQLSFDDALPPPTVTAKLTHPAPDGTKHHTMRDVAVWARKRGLTEDEIRRYTEQVARISGVPIDALAQQRHLDNLVAWTVRNVQPSL